MCRDFVRSKRHCYPAISSTNPYSNRSGTSLTLPNAAQRENGSFGIRLKFWTNCSLASRMYSGFSMVIAIVMTLKLGVQHSRRLRKIMLFRFCCRTGNVSIGLLTCISGSLSGESSLKKHLESRLVLRIYNDDQKTSSGFTIKYMR